MKQLISILSFLLVIGISACSFLLSSKSPFGTSEWVEYLGGPERNHYSPLNHIKPDNVADLEVAWEYHTGDTGQIQCNPIIVKGILYGMTAFTKPFAIDAATGKEIWKVKSDKADGLSSSRGLVYWEEGLDRRILFTNGQWLHAIDAGTGKPITSFGDAGRTSLKAGLGPTAKDRMVISNTPGTVYQDLIIMPMRLSEGTDAAPGYIQAFNIRTGKLAWVFHTIPHPGEYGYDTWPKDAYKNINVGAANNWAGMAIDKERGILFAPTGSAGPDFYGGNRKGDNLFANCLLALDAKTGRRKWHFQFVHHDILDRDAPAPPNLVTLKINGKAVDAVAQVTKQGFVFVFDRETGKPLFPIEERAVPASDIPGEEAAKTQPFPVKPAPFARQTFTEADINPDAENYRELLDSFRKSRSEGPFTPLSKKGTIVFPGTDGGAEWGGAAVDPDGIMYVNSNEMAWRMSLLPATSAEKLRKMTSGQSIYMRNCSSCHGEERKGNPASGFPSLLGISTKRSPDYVHTVIKKGKGMMPSFNKLSDAQQKALVSFLFGNEKIEPGLDSKEPEGDASLDPYRMTGYNKFLDKNGFPAVRPPWGTLNAIDLNTGEYKWKITYGETPEAQKAGGPITGAESYGGPVITKSGLLFIAGTKDRKFRAYDKKTGKLLWETKLPAAGFATPATYSVNGRQYVVIACGGTKIGASGGDSYVAFALPDKKR